MVALPGDDGKSPGFGKLWWLTTRIIVYLHKVSSQRTPKIWQLRFLKWQYLSEGKKSRFQRCSTIARNQVIDFYRRTPPAEANWKKAMELENPDMQDERGLEKAEAALVN